MIDPLAAATWAIVLFTLGPHPKTLATMPTEYPTFDACEHDRLKDDAAVSHQLFELSRLGQFGNSPRERAGDGSLPFRSVCEEE